jgi:D-3-phosphoglycerate dehydrogenase / 2-oxoglutarate reductase
VTKKVLITDYVWPSVEPEKAVLAAGGAEIIVAPNGDEDTLVELARDVDGILTCFAKVTERVVRAAEKCVVIGRYGVGVDNIDVETATQLGIAVTYVPDYCIPEVSDHVMAMLLSWNRRIVFFDRATKTKGWGTEGLGMRIMRLEGKKLGVVGFGRIGRAVADRARAFGLQVIVADPFVTAEAAQDVGAVKMELPELLGQSDFVTLHSPLMPQTEGMMGKDEFALMRPDSFLINAARGGLIDEDALYDALTSGQLAGAGLDVLVDVDPPIDHRISQLENVIVTPHTAFFSQEAVLELEERAAGEVVSIFQGKMPDNLVNPAVLDHSRTKIG